MLKRSSLCMKKVIKKTPSQRLRGISLLILEHYQSIVLQVDQAQRRSMPDEQAARLCFYGGKKTKQTEPKKKKRSIIF